MITSLRQTLSDAYQSLPRMTLNSPEKMLERVGQIAVPAMLILGAAHAKCAEAVIGLCIGCVACLSGGGGPACIPLCIACGVLIPVPAGIAQNN